MNIDVKILSAFISVIVSVLTFLLIHLYIESKKAKRNFKTKQYKNLYAPLYSMIIFSVNIVKEESIRDRCIYLGYASDRTYLITQILNNSFLRMQVLLV